MLWKGSRTAAAASSLHRSNSCVAPAKRGDFVFEVQIAFISITKDAGLPNVPGFNEALTVVLTPAFRSARVQALDQQPQTHSLSYQSTTWGLNLLQKVLWRLLRGQLGVRGRACM